LREHFAAGEADGMADRRAWVFVGGQVKWFFIRWGERCASLTA
jgi:hypothetical protein